MEVLYTDTAVGRRASSCVRDLSPFAVNKRGTIY